MIDRLWNANLGLRISTEVGISKVCISVGNSKVCIPEHHHHRPYQATTAQFVSFLLCWLPLLCFLNFLVGAMKDKRLTKKISLPISNRLCLTRLEAHMTLSS